MNTIENKFKKLVIFIILILFGLGIIFKTSISAMCNNFSKSKLANSIYLEESGELVYKDYSDAIIVDNICTIKLENIQCILNGNKIKSIILYNDRGDVTKEFRESTAGIYYRIEQKGIYYLCALTEGGDIVNLKEYVSIEYILEEENINEKGNIINLLSSCEKILLSNGGKEEINQKSSSLVQDRSKEFLKTFSQDYPTFELIDYVVGVEENFPIRLVAIGENKENGTSSTLFIVDDNGVGQVVLASEYFATYRREDGLYLDKNNISISLDLEKRDIGVEIHDFNVTVAQEEHQGKINTIYSSQETIRK